MVADIIVVCPSYRYLDKVSRSSIDIRPWACLKLTIARMVPCWDLVFARLQLAMRTNHPDFHAVSLILRGQKAPSSGYIEL